MSCGEARAESAAIAAAQRKKMGQPQKKGQNRGLGKKGMRGGDQEAGASTMITLTWW